MLYRLVDEHRPIYGVKPICKTLQVAPSGYRRHAARRSYQRRLFGRSEIETRVVEADSARVHVELRRKGVTRRTGR